MPIIIPSKKIYSIDTPILLDNKIKNIDVPLLLGSPKLEQTTLATLSSTEKSPDESYLVKGTHAVADLYKYGASNNYYDDYKEDEYKNAVAIRGFYLDFIGAFPRELNVDYFGDFELSYSIKATKYEREVTKTEYDSLLKRYTSFTVEKRQNGETVDYIPYIATVTGYPPPPYELSVEAPYQSPPTTISRNEENGEIKIEVKNLYVGCSILKLHASGEYADIVEDYVPNSITIEIGGTKVTYETSEILQRLSAPNGSDGISLSLDGSCFLLFNKFYPPETTGYEDTLTEYSNGKTLATVLCSIGEYEDQSEKVVINPKSNEKSLFDIYDEAFVMIRNEYGVDFPLNNKIYKVLGHNFYFDGAVWQKLTLQDIYEAPTEIVKYTLSQDETTYSISGLNNTDECDRVVLSSEHLEKPVAEISQYAFKRNYIRSIVIPDGIKTISQQAFYECVRLKTINLPNSIVSIEDNALRACPQLEGIELPEGLINLGVSAVAECPKLAGLKIPKTITSISQGLAVGCTSLANIGLHESIVSIGEYAFQGCTSLRNIKLNNGLKTLGYGAFSLCTGLTEAYIPSSIAVIEPYVFYDCYSLHTIDLPIGLSTIGDSAFAHSGLTQVNLPDTVTFVGNFAFGECKNAKTITIGENVATIDTNGFDGCTGLRTLYFNAIDCNAGGSGNRSPFTACGTPKSGFDVVFGGKVENIPSYLFRAWTNGTDYVYSYVASANMLGSVESIGTEAFCDCISLRTIVMGNNIKRIGLSAFKNCSQLTVYYHGTETDWANTQISAGNEPLLNARFSFVD